MELIVGILALIGAILVLATTVIQDYNRKYGWCDHPPEKQSFYIGDDGVDRWIQCDQCGLQYN